MSQVKDGLPKQADVVIVGGGAIGLCCAYSLTQAGREVTLLEQNELLAGCSGENAGLIVPSHIEPLANPAILAQGMLWLLRKRSPFRIKPRVDLALMRWLWAFHKACRPHIVQQNMAILHQLLQESRLLFDTMADDLGIAKPAAKGLLMVHRSEKGSRGHQSLASSAAKMGLATEFLSREALFQREPNAPTASTGALFFPTDAHIHPRNFLTSIAKHLERSGNCAIYQNTQFEQLQEDGNIVTNRGNILADQVLLTTGSWSAKLARPYKKYLPIQPGKGYTLSLPATESAPKIPMILAEEKVSITPFRDSLRFGGTLELAGFDPKVQFDRTHLIQQVARQYDADFDSRHIGVEHFWQGYRPCTPDGLPIIGYLDPGKRVAVATGHAMLGITLAPVTGKLVAQMLAGGPLPDPLAKISPQRF